MKRFFCQNCGNEVHFDSTRCVSCGRALGYEPERTLILAGDNGTWRSPDGAAFQACANARHLACNWLVAHGAGEQRCIACRHNRTIPDLSEGESLRRWQALELAKRRLFYSLLRWNLPVPVKIAPDDDGLAFDFLADVERPDGTREPVMTGHANGLITINIAEGDDAERERRRTAMGEPYRTLVGHFRHEVGHYYWERLVSDRGEAELSRCRAVFGDEREDYAQALERHYAEGPPADWTERTISAYAAAHPWEDFAETFAHYVHIVDVLETAHGYGLLTSVAAAQVGLALEDPYREGTLRELVNAWVPITVAINAINRAMGQPDLYPFVLSSPVEQKLSYIHRLIRSCCDSAMPLVPTDVAAP